MKIVATIAEYNPLHTGHLYHIERTKSELHPDLYVVVLSGNFSERGDIAIKEKHIRAKWAIEAGADIVLELPYVYSVNCAELFAKGGMKVLSCFNSPVTLSFGSECGDIQKLEELSSIKFDEKIKENFHSNISSGVSYPKAMADALNIEDLTPNNTLGIEYIRAGKKYNFDMFTIKRFGDYNSQEISGDFASATAIRDYINRDKTLDILEFLPKFTQKSLENCTFNNDMSDAILYKLATMKTSDLHDISDVSEGLENRIKEMAKISKNYDELIYNIKTKRYTMARIKRILINTLCGLDKNTRDRLLNTSPYARVLAVKSARTDALTLLSKSNLIIKSSDIQNMPDDVKKSIEFEESVDAIYSVISKTPTHFNGIFVD